MNNVNLENGPIETQLFLHEDDRKELHDSGISNEFIELNQIKSISVSEALAMGFYAVSDTDNKEPLLQDQYVSRCLYFPFFDQKGSQIIDEITHKLIGVIKPRYTDFAKHKFIDLPKYLCQTKQAQSRMYIHFPKNNLIDWEDYLNSGQRLKVYMTEGIKKAIKGCQEGLPCIAIWAPWCFSENKIDSSPLISELKNLLVQNKVDLILVFDSDKYIKPSIIQAEYALANKVRVETGLRIKKLDLPSRFQGKPTKGLDDFLCIATKDDFLAIKLEKITTAYISGQEMANLRPKAPLESLPEPFVDAINDISSKLEGSLEIGVAALIASVIGPCYNVITSENQRLNLFLIGLAPTTAGKTSIAKACFKPASALNDELMRGFFEMLAKGEKENSDTEPNLNEGEKDA